MILESGAFSSATLVCVGASHRTAEVGELERVMPRAEQAHAVFERGSADDVLPAAITELAVLTTCNRVELYVACAPGASSMVAASLRALLSDGDAHSGDQLYEHHGRDAVRHLCRVASGLDSLVIGEPEIAGQVSRAFQLIHHRNGGAPQLAGVARTARIAGRRARAETAISRKPASVSTVAVHLLAEHIGGLAGRRILVVGAGRMGTVACEVLSAEGACVTVVNRTQSRADLLAQRLFVTAQPWEDLARVIAESDAVMLTTSSPIPIVDERVLDTALADRASGGGLVIVDLGVPRNITEQVRARSGVQVLDIDDLRSRVEAHLGERRDEVPRVEAIIEEEIASWERGDNTMLPVIGDLHRHAERVRHRELERALSAMGPMDTDARERIEHLTRALVNQLLHGPSSRLRAAAGTTLGEDYARVVRDLWALDDAAEPPQS
jgi:glutamyl-tRNA reductase